MVDVLARLREDVREYGEGRDDFFNAEQNALVAKNAEQYYREMVGGDVDSWNVRDRHMVETLDRLRDHHGSDAKGIVWAHNNHIGDARRQTWKHVVGSTSASSSVNGPAGRTLHSSVWARIEGASSPRARGMRRWRS